MALLLVGTWLISFFNVYFYFTKRMCFRVKVAEEYVVEGSSFTQYPYFDSLLNQPKPLDHQ